MKEVHTFHYKKGSFITQKKKKKNSRTPKKKERKKTTTVVQINRNSLFLQLYSQLVLGKLLRGCVRGFRTLA